jgi:hypothetical protein
MHPHKYIHPKRKKKKTKTKNQKPIERQEIPLKKLTKSQRIPFGWVNGNL